MSIYQGREQLALIWVGVGIWKVALVVDNSGGSGRLVDGDGGKKEPMIQLWLNCAARFGHPRPLSKGHTPHASREEGLCMTVISLRTGYNFHWNKGERKVSLNCLKP